MICSGAGPGVGKDLVRYGVEGESFFKVTVLGVVCGFEDVSENVENLKKYDLIKAIEHKVGYDRQS